MKAAYDRWHEALSAEFFGPDHALRSTVLYVDDEVERELAERHGIGTGLARAVADRLDWSGPEKTLFRCVQDQCSIWRGQECTGAPPSLPVLALSVLAATRMVSSEDMRSSNYYGRWAQLFGVERGSRRANRLQHAFTDVVEMWCQLDAWLEDTGGLNGMSTISTDERYRRIGYPVSQALIRGADRQILTRFFAASRLRPGNPDEVPGRELLRRLRLWTAGRDRHLSPRLVEELEEAADSSSDALITSLLKRLADDWDGTLHEPGRKRRRRALGLRLVIASRGKRLEWLAEAAEGSPEETAVALPGGRSFALRRDYGGVYSGLETLTPSEYQLSRGLRLEGDDLVLEWAPQDVVLFRAHPHLGEWVSTDYFEPGEQHWILAAEAVAGRIRSAAEALGGRRAREAPAPAPGWRVFKGVRAASEEAFARTVDRGGAQAHVFQPRVRQRTKLCGGLRIAREYRAGAGVAGHYLRGGEPDLLLPASSIPGGTVEAVLNERTQRLDPRFPFPLRVLGLEKGEYRVGTAEDTQVFTVYDGVVEGLPAGTGSLGYVCTGTAAREPSSTSGMCGSAIRGAEAPLSAALPRTVLVRCSAQEAFLIDPCGGVRPLREQSAPRWMSERLPEEACGPLLEVEVPDGFIWLVYRTAARWSVRALVPVGEVPPPQPRQDDYVWAYVVVSAAGRCRAPVWLQYVAAAEEITGKRGAA